MVLACILNVNHSSCQDYYTIEYIKDEGAKDKVRVMDFFFMIANSVEISDEIGS